MASDSKFTIEAAFRAVDRMTAPIRRMRWSVDSLSRSAKGLKMLDAGFGALNRKLLTTAKYGALAGVGVAAGAGLVLSAGSDFEQAITNVAAVSLRSREEIAALEAEAKRLGATTKFTATESANAMEVMARAGFKDREILAGVGPILSAAAASGLEIAEVADHVSNALKGMGLEATEAGRVADVLALASSKTNSSIGSLGESLSNVSSTARQFKIPLEDVVAGVALLQDVGLDASVAGSAMNTMLTKMAAPTDEIVGQMRKMGVTFKDAKGNMLPFSEVLGQLAKAAEKSGGNMDQVAFLADLVGLRGQKAAANLADLFSSGKVTTLTKELEVAAGAAQKMAEIRMNTLQGDVTLLGSAIDAVKVGLFETESGPLRDVVQGMTKWVGENEKLIVSGFVDFMTDVRDNIDSITSALKFLGLSVGVFYGMAAAVKFAKGALVLLEAAAWAATTATDALAFANGTLATTERTGTGAIIFGTGIRWARNAANWAVQASTWAYNAAITISEAMTKKTTLAEIAGTGARWARNAATWAVGAATWAYNAAITAGLAPMAGMTAATWASVPALWAAAAPLLPLVGAIAGVTLAVVALKKAWDGLMSALGGSDKLGATLSKMWEMGTLDIFAANDAVLNEKARADAQKRFAASPAERTARAVEEHRTTNSAEVTVKAEAGTSARVSKKPKGPGGLKLATSGGT